MITSVPQHRVAVIVHGEQFEGWSSYEITRSLTDVPSTFSLRAPWSRRAWDMCAPDRPVTITVDDVPIITGFIDDEQAPDDVIEITGRCKLARVWSDAAPGISFAGLGIEEIVRELVKPWFAGATLSNARNRNVTRGKGKKARAASEPIRIASKVGTRIEPGQTRGAVIDRMLEQAGYLVWSSGDGREVVVGKPNYSQEIQFRFFRPAPISSRKDEQTVLELTPKRSTGDRFSRVIVVGSGVGTDVNYGTPVASRSGEALNNPHDPDGVGEDFTSPKRLVIQRTVASAKDAAEFAAREMATRDAQGDVFTARCAGHGQRIAGAFTTLFAPDVLASVEDERTGIAGRYLIAECTFSSGRGEGETTTMTLVRQGAELSR